MLDWGSHDVLLGAEDLVLLYARPLHLQSVHDFAFTRSLDGRNRVRVFQGRKGNPNPNFLVWIFSGGVGSSTWMGGGQKVRHVPRSQENQTFRAGHPGILPGYPGGARKVWEKNVCVRFSSPSFATRAPSKNLLSSFWALVLSAGVRADPLRKACLDRISDHCVS